MGEHLGFGDMGRAAELFHVRPNIGAVEGAAGASDENRATSDALLLAVAAEQSAELLGQKHPASLPFPGDLGHAVVHRLGGDIAQFRHTDAGGADGLHQEVEAVIFLLFGGSQKAVVFGFGQLLVGWGEDLFLDLDIFYTQIMPFHVGKESVECRQGGVDTGGGIAGD